MEDNRIVDLYWQRDEVAIAHTKHKYGRMLTGISVSLVPSREDAEECVSDTYLAAWNSMPTERPAYLGAFLAKITRRLSISKYRTISAEKRGGADMLTEELTDCVPDNYSLEADFENGTLAEALNRFLFRLDKEKRYIFIRRYFFSDGILDIAKRTGIKEATVKTVLHRTRNALKTFLEEEGFGV